MSYCSKELGLLDKAQLLLKLTRRRSRGEGHLTTASQLAQMFWLKARRGIGPAYYLSQTRPPLVWVRCKPARACVARFCQPGVQSDLLFPGDRLLYLPQLARFIRDLISRKGQR